MIQIGYKGQMLKIIVSIMHGNNYSYELFSHLVYKCIYIYNILYMVKNRIKHVGKSRCDHDNKNRSKVIQHE